MITPVLFLQTPGSLRSPLSLRYAPFRWAKLVGQSGPERQTHIYLRCASSPGLDWSSAVVGKHFSHYRVIEELGSGGMGVVYLAEDLTLGRQVALKFLLDNVGLDDVSSARFKREARLAAAINHPNVCTIFEVGEFEGRPYIAMELLQGRSLRQHISGHHIPLQQLVDWTLQMVAALEAAHALGILHRDLKPANLFIVSANRLKVLDFGLSKLLPHAELTMVGASGTTQTALQTTPGGAIGTPAYMSPEQVRGDILDKRSDLFSLGVVMYEMATRKLPFEGRTAAASMAAILRDEPHDPDLLNASLPPEMCRIVLKALEKNREFRYQSAEDLLADLKRLTNNSDPKLTKRSPERLTLLRGRKIVLTCALAALVAAGCLALILSRQLRPPHILSTLELTHDRLAKSGPLLTDGSRVYFNAGLMPFVPYGVSSLGGESFKVPIGVSNARLLAESPNGSEFLLRASTDPDLLSVGNDPLPLWVSSTTGGSLRRLGDLWGGSASWSPDGQHLVYSKHGELDVAMSDGSEARTLVKVPGLPFAINWSPDGKLIRFSLEESRQIWEVRSDGTQLRALFPAWHNPQCCGKWTPDGKYFVFEAESHGTRDIWAVRERRGIFAMAEREPIRLTSGPLSSSDPVPSTDGKRIFVNSHKARSETVRYDLSTKTLAEFLPGLSIEGLDFTRDGKWVTYVTFPEGILWRSRIDGQDRLQLTQMPMQANLPRWSPDGMQIVFMGSRTDLHKRSQVYLISAQGGAPRQLTDGRNSTGYDPTWSSDGLSIALGGGFTTDGETIINLLNLTTHKISPVPGSTGYYSPRWSPDGHYIAALSKSGEAVTVFSFASQKWTELTNLVPGFITWSKDSSFIYFDTANSSPSLFRARVSDHKVERIFDFKGFQQAPGTFGFWNGLAPDGSPLFQRDLTLDQIYSLEWETP